METLQDRSYKKYSNELTERPQLLLQYPINARQKKDKSKSITNDSITNMT